MNKLKKIFFAFLALILTFILSATTFGEYHSALSVIYGFIAGGLFIHYYDEFSNKL